MAQIAGKRRCLECMFAAKSAILSRSQTGHKGHDVCWNEIEDFNLIQVLYKFCKCAPMERTGDTLKEK